MCGSLPVTCVTKLIGYPPEAFCLYDRYMINAYQDAQELGVSGWNITQAFLDFANAYLQMPFQIRVVEILKAICSGLILH